ncbi:hypothetical protein TNCT_568751 [Trichonephila clavata]|uniref:Uncharacterized protein n=1 Tax=Trichonephila clavata TaxID=2740835 RepID=A0A8X6HLS7_TRICU|nr:hypothetical protein TNCT_568751 [Trichonephila clavata]
MFITVMILKSVRFLIQTRHQISQKLSKRTSKVKKTPAKRMREYRALKKARIQSTNDSPSVVHHQDDGILQADDNLNKPYAFVGLPCQDINVTCKRTPAKCMRDYRARKKIYLQSTSDSYSVVHHQEDENLLADDNLNSSLEFVELPCQDINATRKKNAS